MRSGNRESVSGLIESFNGDQLTSKEFLDFVVSKGELKEEFAAAISQRIVMEARCGSAWVGCLLGLSDFGEFASGTYQNAIFILLRQANIANGEYNRTVLPQDEQRRTEEAREVALQETERVRGEEQRRTAEVLGNVHARVETAIERERQQTKRVAGDVDIRVEQARTDGQVRIAQETRETERLVQMGAERRLGIQVGVGIGGGAGAAAGMAAGIAAGSVFPGAGNIVVGGLLGLAFGLAGGGGLGVGIAAAVHPRPE
ncbi:MAG: hypothetical protein LBS68_01250 [Puniceicoccales bacterium]|nr:hypothetical protein [Puniceicoccales bacterium]